MGISTEFNRQSLIPGIVLATQDVKAQKSADALFLQTAESRFGETAPVSAPGLGVAGPQG